MNLPELKSRMLDDSAQIVVFRKEDGLMVDSCHKLSDVSGWQGQSLYDLIPLLKSMAMVWANIGEEVVDIPCVDFVLEQRQGYYDFVFRRHPDNPDLILWLIKDQTRIYRYYQGIQQERNEMRLRQDLA